MIEITNKKLIQSDYIDHEGNLIMYVVIEKHRNGSPSVAEEVIENDGKFYVENEYYVKQSKLIKKSDYK